MVAYDGIYELGSLRLQKGGKLEDARLAFRTYGGLNASKDNLVVCPTYFAGGQDGYDWLIGSGKALDPEKYFVVVPGILGNGFSSSPSNEVDHEQFPRVTINDNVRLQHRFLTEKFGITKIRLATGWSMGAMQAFQWAALYPEMVERIAPFCGSAKCSRHNFVFLEGIKAALQADSAWESGCYKVPPDKGIRAFARVYAGWGFSQAFYRQELYSKAIGFTSLEEFLVNFWEAFFLTKDANDLLAMIWTWQNGDLSDNELYHGDVDMALQAIKAKAFVMPGQTDLYFPPEDSANEVSSMPNAELVPIPSVWGHFAGGFGMNPADAGFIDGKLRELLSS